MFKSKIKFQDQSSLNKLDLRHRAHKIAIVVKKLTREELKSLISLLIWEGVSKMHFVYDQIEISPDIQKILVEIVYKNFLDEQIKSSHKPDQMLLNLRLIWLQSRLEEEIYEVLLFNPRLMGNSVLSYLT